MDAEPTHMEEQLCIQIPNSRAGYPIPVHLIAANNLQLTHPHPSPWAAGMVEREVGWARRESRDQLCWDTENTWKGYGSFQEGKEENSRPLWLKDLKPSHDTASQNILAVFLTLAIDIFVSYIILSRSKIEKRNLTYGKLWGLELTSALHAPHWVNSYFSFEVVIQIHPFRDVKHNPSSF